MTNKNDTFLDSTKKVLKSKFKRCSLETYKSRLIACAECDNLNSKNVCLACNCYVKYKATFEKLECPLGKWIKTNIEK